jgi:hypothetical protein
LTAPPRLPGNFDCVADVTSKLGVVRDRVQDYFSSSDARQRQTAQIQAEMERTKDVMHETIGESCNFPQPRSHAAIASRVCR